MRVPHKRNSDVFPYGAVRHTYSYSAGEKYLCGGTYSLKWPGKADFKETFHDIFILLSEFLFARNLLRGKCRRSVFLPHV